MLPEKVRAVEEVFDTLDREIASFQSRSGLYCNLGCGKCCFKSDIEATVLEFLPLAQHLYSQGKVFEWLEKLEANSSPICQLLNPTKHAPGLCSEYKHRALICRLFGYSARTNKYGAKELVTCQVIKSEQTANFQAAELAMNASGGVPVMSHYYIRLHAIDFELTREFFPINEAIKRAIEVILHYYAYQE